MLEIRFIILCLVLFFIQNGRGLNKDPVVVTKVGTIRGVKGYGYTSYLGIPYAMVNQSNYFGDSLPHPPFEDTFEATDDSHICPQRHDIKNTLLGSLDCLRLNIYVPDTVSVSKPAPIMLFIYGGRFAVGFSGAYIYGPEYLIRHDIIFVTINYRLGPYGFMCLDVPEVPGNQGLKDQARAIKWVKDHISDFGGDPERITLAGHSGGAMSIALHLISDQQKNFNGVIMQSGSALYPLLIKEKDTNFPIKIAEKLGAKTTNVYEALKVLQAANINAVIEASEQEIYRPCVERKFEGVESFLTDHPINLKPKVANMSILQGNADTEEQFAYDIDLYDPLVFYKTLFKVFDPKLSANEISELSEIVKRFYIGNEEINETQRRKLVEFCADFTFIYPAMRNLDWFFESNATKVYHYILGYNGGRNYVKIRSSLNAPGAAHGDDLGYLFNMSWTGMPQPTVADQLIIDRMTAMWANFVKFGDPTPEKTDLLPVKWLPITKTSPRHYLAINTKLEAGTAHYHKRIAFWEVFFKAYEKYQTGFFAP